MTKSNDIREAAEEKLGFDPLVDATDITVRNMNGDLTLNGTVPSYPQLAPAASRCPCLPSPPAAPARKWKTTFPAPSSD